MSTLTLHTFFSRYYDKGDFISQRRYKSDTYAIPYEGEEVKLYWANQDQYYIKSSEHLRDYAFTVEQDDEKSIRIHLVEADTEKDNVKAKRDEERRFVLDSENPLAIKDSELTIRFLYVPVGKKKQDKLNSDAVKTIFEQEGFDEWLELLKQKSPTAKNPDRTLLEKHLNDYTARNTFDYFIHKDLGGFLRRELDFYIKNEVLHLDDIDDAAFEVTEQQLRKIKVIRTIAHKFIRMLAQLEDFQKKLWLKKKFVVESNYCISLNLLPKQLYPEIQTNENQIQEWKFLGFIDQDTNIGDIDDDFLSNRNHLIIDTKNFSLDFKQRLESHLDFKEHGNIPVCVKGDNFQALNLLLANYKDQIGQIYIDPPYNTGNDGFIYKDTYQSSSWLSMMLDRLLLARELLNDKGLVFTSINEVERNNLESLLSFVFGKDSRIEELIWARDTVSNNATAYSTNHEYIEVFSKYKSKVLNDKSKFRVQREGYKEVMEIVESISGEYPPLENVTTLITNLYKEHARQHVQLSQSEGVSKEEAKKTDSWKGLYPYKFAEYRDDNGNYVSEEDARKQAANIWVYREVEPSMPAGKQADSTRDPASPNYRFYEPIDPISGKKGKPPRAGWAFPLKPLDGRPSFNEHCKNNKIKFKGEGKISQIKYFLHQVESVISTSVIRQYADGEPKLEAMFGVKGLIDNPKPPMLIRKILDQVAEDNSIIMDFFAGSGTTGSATIEYNIEKNKNICFMLIEQGAYFHNVLIPRIKKSYYSSNWKDGQPLNSNHSQCIFKCIELESYEDTLSNLVFKDRSKQQQDLIEAHAGLREDYMLSYWLDVETTESGSLLDIVQFEDPFNYKLNIATGSVGATKPTRVDLVETFNYLLGLTVKHIDTLRSFRVISGTNPKDETVLVIWRNVEEQDNATLEEFLDKSGYNPKDTEYDHIYVNGDHTLEDPHSKVKMIEIEFKRLMFDAQDA